MDRPSTLNERQVLAAQALAAGFTWRDAAKRAKCSTEGIRAWKQTEEFNNAMGIIPRLYSVIFPQSNRLISPWEREYLLLNV